MTVLAGRVPNEEERRSTWEAMLDTELAVHYWARIAYRLEDRDKKCGYVAFMFTIATAATVGLQLHQWAQVAATLITAAVTGVAVFFRFGRASEQAAQLHRLNAEAALEYEGLWNRINEIDATELREAHEALQRNLILSGQAAVREFDEDKELTKQAHAKVLEQHGFTKRDE